MLPITKEMKSYIFNGLSDLKDVCNSFTSVPVTRKLSTVITLEGGFPEINHNDRYCFSVMFFNTKTSLVIAVPI